MGLTSIENDHCDMIPATMCKETIARVLKIKCYYSITPIVGRKKQSKNITLFPTLPNDEHATTLSHQSQPYGINKAKESLETSKSPLIG